MVSFDEVSLYNVPDEEASIIAKEKFSDGTLSKRTKLPFENIHDLLKLWVTARCFQW